MNNRELNFYVERYISGDCSAFDIIYEETKQNVYLSIYAIIKNRTVIEDLMQEVYMKVIDSLDYFKVGTNFRAWISKIARNQTINYYNRQKRELIVEDTSPTIINQATYNKTDSLLDASLSILEGYEREIFIYRIVFDLTLKEVSNIMEMPLSTVNYIYKNTLKKIKKEVVGKSL